MAETNSFRTARWLRTLHLVLQAGLLLTFLAGLNYLARDHPLRFDLTQHRSYSLSPETLSYLHLERPVRIIATIPENTENPEVRGLLREYATAANSLFDQLDVNNDGTITAKEFNPRGPAKGATPGQGSRQGGRRDRRGQGGGPPPSQ